MNPLNPRYPMLDGNARPQPLPTFEAADLLHRLRNLGSGSNWSVAVLLVTSLTL